MPRGDFAPFGHSLGTVGLGDRAAWVEAAAGGRVDRTGYIPGQDGTTAGAVFFRVWYRYRREQRLGVRVERMLIEFITVGQFGHHAQVHDRHPVTDVADHAEVMSNE